MSTYIFFPPGPDPNAARRERMEQPRNLPPQEPQHQTHRAHLSPFSPQPASSSVSPAVNAHTPAESESALSVHYQSSEFTEVDDPFFGLDFSTIEGASPSFFGDALLQLDNGPLVDTLNARGPSRTTEHVASGTAYLPLSPDKSPNGETGEDAVARSTFPDLPQASVSPRDLSLTHESSPAPVSKPTALQLTPNTSGSAESSDSGLDPAATMQSPRVTVSHWDKDYVQGSHTPHAEEVLDQGGPKFSAARDDSGRWIPDQATGQAGLGPSARPAAQVDSINDLAARRQLSERNQEIDEWLKRANANPHAPEPAEAPNDGDDNITLREISLGHQTENKVVPGQTYYTETGGQLTREDLELMRQNRNWEDSPLPFSIFQPDSDSAKYQPQTSQAAMEKYQRMCRDNDSIVSRAATWGTRRFSLPSIYDAEVQVTGNLFKKLSLSRGDTRRPSILEGLRGLVRKPSVNSSKRSRPEPDDAKSFKSESSAERKESQAKLAPPSPKPGWSRKQSVPSINTAFVDVGSRVASIGAMHTRAGSVSATPITSPRSPSGLSLSVKKPLNRLRSKSETSGIVDLWKKSGGPPVSNLGNTKVDAPEADDDEDDEDDGLDEGGMKTESTSLIDDITPNFAGFQQHVLRLNPTLSHTNTYLVDRIAHQQVCRYKSLLNFRVKHLQAISAKNCPSGSMCIAQGGRANILDAKGDSCGLDPLSSRYDGEDGDITPLEGAINPDSFPQDIPMPPTASLPAEFECQLCFAAKKFQKPSDWTKHVHEDVQPFTCTWNNCKEHKMFKRKADWVRHENEGHRHLEWWVCDVDDCTHKCFRRDNFLQHLVREHKFTEPKVKTKAAIKRAGGGDPTWAKVEQCHRQTTELPQHEPCRFCGKTFPSWKKLTVHLAKHMEQISLPVLKLVAKKELDEDTIISPVQEPPPRSFPTVLPTRQEQLPFGAPATLPPNQVARQMVYQNPAQHANPMGVFPIAPPPSYPTTLYSANFDDLTHGMAQTQLSMPHMTHHQQQHHHGGFQSLNSQAAFANLPVTTSAATGGYIAATQTSTYTTPQTNTYISMAPDIEPFPAVSMTAMGLGLQDPSSAGVQMGYAGGLVGSSVIPIDQQHRQQGQQLSPQQQQLVSPQYTPQGSVSPYEHSPNMPQGGFY
ncbi:hypothetical protein VTI74DRAFT_10520 [Chaetomium olivicolor]